VTETVAAIVAAHRAGTVSPARTVARSFQRIRDHNDPAIFISLRDEREALAEAETLTKKDTAQLPLYGVPVAVKDNIDVLGLPTTAACPAFAYSPTHDATSVARLRAAGVIVIGKTNLDQFATGLVGVRSPYGIPNNPMRGDLIPGGSSSGSAVAVSAGLVPLALGTDTAGSGRVPAMLNNIVGLKPSLGLISTAGVVPACRTLDCVSIFSLTVDDAMTALAAMAGPDGADPFSQHRPLAAMQPFPGQIRLGVPRQGQLIFFGDKAAENAYGDAVARWIALGATLVECDLEPFYETARLLYEGPWVAERYLVIRNLLASSPDAISPGDARDHGGRLTPHRRGYICRTIPAAGATPHHRACFCPSRRTGAADSADRLFDCAGAGQSDRTQQPARHLHQFVNLLDLCGLALPASIRSDDIPFGITLLAPAGHDAQLASIGRVFHADTRLAMGSRNLQQPPLAPLLTGVSGDEIAIAVVGAHLSGMALNGELKALGGRLLQATATAPDYKLYALKGTTPPKPGMLRVKPGAGSAIQLELWALSAAAFGKFVASIPPPLSIGTIRLADGSGMKGFLVEPAAIDGARDISAFGGWRAFMAEATAPAK